MKLSHGLESFLATLRKRRHAGAVGESAAAARAAGGAPGGIEVLEERRMLAVQITNCTGPSSRPETDNSAYTLALAATYDEDTPLEYWSVDWGDGTVSSYGPDASLNVEHDYAKDGTVNRTIAVTLYGNQGTYGSQPTASASHQVQVYDVAPTREVSGEQKVYGGEAYTLTRSAYSDVPLDPAIRWFIDWGDGSDPDNDNVVGQVFQGNPNTFVHTYDPGAVVGTWDITGSVENKDGVFPFAPLQAQAPIMLNYGDPAAHGASTVKRLKIDTGSNPKVDTFQSILATLGPNGPAANVPSWQVNVYVAGTTTLATGVNAVVSGVQGGGVGTYKVTFTYAAGTTGDFDVDIVATGERNHIRVYIKI